MRLGFDIETNGLSAWADDARIVSAAAHPELGAGWTEVYYHPDYFRQDPKTKKINKLLSEGWNTIYGHNLMFDVVWWEKHVGPVNACMFDTLVAQSLLDETFTPNSLHHLTVAYLGPDDQYAEDDKKKRLTPLEQDVTWLMHYNHRDAKNSLLIGMELEEKLRREGKLPLMHALMRAQRTLCNMVGRGVHIDVDFLHDHNIEYAGELGDLNDFFDDLDVNPGSPKQLVQLLYHDLNLPIMDTTKTGQPSTATHVLEKLANVAGTEEQRTTLSKLLRHREVNKKISTYYQPVLDEHMAPDGRVHGQYHLGRSDWGGTVTGRLSSSRPNLQNIPRDPTVKGIYAPSPGMLMFDADYGQIEMRVAGFLSQDEKLLETFREGKDMHTSALANIYGKEYDEAVELVESDPDWKARRTATKIVNFGILYGATPHTIHEQLRRMGTGMSVSEVTQLMKDWRTTYEGFARWEHAVKGIIERDRVITTDVGRTRHLDFQSGVTRAHRQGVNFLIQSLAADITTLSLEHIEQRVTRGNILMTVHDSVVGEHEPEYDPTDDVIAAMTVDVLCTLRSFDIDTSTLYLDVDVDTHLPRWGGESIK